MKVRLVAVLWFLAGGAAHAAPNWAGYWAVDRAWCANIGAMGTLEKPIYLADTEISGIEATCDIVNHEAGPVKGSFVLETYCAADTDPFEETIILLEGEKDQLYLYREGGIMVTLQRCR